MIDLSDRAELRWLASVVADIAAADLLQQPILIGALARDVLLKHAHGINTGRATEDADFAIAVAGWSDFEHIKEQLIAGGAFRPSRRSVQRLEHVEMHWVDLIPFGSLERGDRTIAWPPGGDPILNVLGLQEAEATAVVIGLPDNQQIHTVALPMLVALKLLAWEDRRKAGDDKDAEDLMIILENYLDAGNLDRYPEDADRVLGEVLDHATAGALVAGRDLGAMLTALGDSPVLLGSSLSRILSREVELDSDGTLIFAMAGTSGDYALNLIRALMTGMSARG